ncbi:MAG: DUF4097 family beta strand repeat protein, partial [Candidatus Aminicenantes bacterium]|nr:DUF4097 family beta strand repeat protein [Candidatus Aminicenantes bacterium]
MRMRNESLKLACLVGAALVVLSLGSAAARNDYQEKFEKTLDLAMDGKVFLSNVSGDIKIYTWDKAQVKIDALKSAKNEEGAKGVTIEVTGDAGVVRIETKYPKRSWFGGDSGNASVDFTLHIPAKASIDATSVSGDVALEAIGGSARAKSVSGDVSLSKAGGGAECSSVSGDVDVADVKGGLDAGSVSGDVTASRIEGSVEATSVSGDVVLRDIAGAVTVKAKTVSGDVLFEGLSVPKGRYHLESHSGDVTVNLPAEAAFELEAGTFSGDIDSNFEI